MRLAGRAARDVLEIAATYCVPGVTTLEIDQVVAREISARGAMSAFHGYRGFPGQCCISINDEVVHGIGSPHRRLQYGDIVKLDVGLTLDGWIGDTAKTVPVGMISSDIQRLLDVTEEALRLAIKQARPGNRVGDISNAVETFAHRHGYSVVQELVGHGVGRRLHEDPQVPNFGQPHSGPKLKPGMTIAIEPMINMGVSHVIFHKDNWTVSTADGKPSAHFEHSVVITEHGADILTWPTPTTLQQKA